MRKNIDVISTAVASLVGGLCSKKQEVGRVIESWQSVVVCCVGGGEGELEGASWVLWLDGASDGEGGALEYLKLLLLGLRDTIHGGGHRDVGLNQQVYKYRSLFLFLSLYMLDLFPHLLSSRLSPSHLRCEWRRQGRDMRREE